MKYFRINREDFWELFPDISKKEQPEKLYVYEDGTAYAELSDAVYPPFPKFIPINTSKFYK